MCLTYNLPEKPEYVSIILPVPCLCEWLCRCKLNPSVLPIPDIGSEERLQPRSETRLPDTSPAACAEAAPNPRRVQPPPEKPTTIQRAKGQSGTTSLCKKIIDSEELLDAYFMCMIAY